MPGHPNIPTIGFITTCKGRLQHLKRTLPRIVEQNPDEIIVVDFNCPDNSGRWVEDNFAKVKVIYIRDDAPFNVSIARNSGIAASRSDVLCMIDADILIEPKFVDWIKANAAQRTFFRPTRNVGAATAETWGTFICPRDLILEVGLYDDTFAGWGGEDDDIYYRLKLSGSLEKTFPSRFIHPITHGEEERLAWYREKDRRMHLLVNQTYIEAKRILLGFSWPKTELPREARKHIWNEVKAHITSPEINTEVRIAISTDGWVPQPFRLQKTIRLELKVSRPPSDPDLQS